MDFDSVRESGIAAMDANRFAEAYRIFLPLVEAGDPECQGIVGSLMRCGMHRIESLEQMNSSEGQVMMRESSQGFDDKAVAFLKSSSDAGFGPATFNLAALYVDGYGGGSWGERKAKAAELYALAHAQGFTEFGHLMNGTGPGQPYLDLMEAYVASIGSSEP